MKSKKPLQAKTALKAKVKFIKPVSDRYQPELDEYHKQAAAYLLDNTLCSVCMDGPVGTVVNLAIEVHHKARRGKNLLNQETWLPVCRKHHTQIENNPKWAKERGYLL